MISLVQIMACRLSAPSHYLNQCWLVNWNLGNNFQGNSNIEIQTFRFKKIHVKMSSAKWRPTCLGLNVLKNIHIYDAVSEVSLSLLPQKVNIQSTWFIWGLSMGKQSHRKVFCMCLSSIHTLYPIVLREAITWSRPKLYADLVHLCH